MKDRFWSEEILSIVLGILFVTGAIVICVLAAVEHGDATQKQQTQRQGQLVAACKSAVDPQTCLELLISPTSAHIINK